MKKFQKLLAFMLVFVMALSTTATAYAAKKTDPYNTVVLVNDKSVKVVETSDNDFIYTSTYDKKNGTVQLIQTEKSTGIVKAGDVATIPNLTEEPTDQVTTLATLEEKTFTNYEYEITYGSPNTWELRRPGDNAFSWVYFKTKQTVTNGSYLTAFRNAVDQINIQEGAIVTSLGMVGLSAVAAAAAGAGAIFTGGTLSGPAWAAILASLGFAATHIAVCMAYDQSCKNAYDAYFNTYYNSVVFY